MRMFRKYAVHSPSSDVVIEWSILRWTLSFFLLVHLMVVSAVDEGYPSVSPKYYTAAAAQLSPVGSFHNSAQENMRLSVAEFAAFVSDAKDRGVEIIVFPEAVLYSYGSLKRATLLPYSEDIPMVNNGNDSVLPCFDDSYAIDGVSMLREFSCMARNNSMVVVVNIIDRKTCTGADPDCPSDGYYLYNTNVAFSEQGFILSVYHKYHLFGEEPVKNVPLRPQPAFFDTSFGVRFGQIVCYDMQYMHPASDLIGQGITDILMSTSWFNMPPLVSAHMLQQGWSRLSGANFIVANNAESPAVSGGGIYSAGDPIATFFNTSTSAFKSRQLVVGRVPLLHRSSSGTSNKKVDPRTSVEEEVSDSASRTTGSGATATGGFGVVTAQQVRVRRGSSERGSGGGIDVGTSDPTDLPIQSSGGGGSSLSTAEDDPPASRPQMFPMALTSNLTISPPPPDKGEPCWVAGYGPRNPRCQFFHATPGESGWLQASHNGLQCSVSFDVAPTATTTTTAKATTLTATGAAKPAASTNDMIYAVYAYSDTQRFDAYTPPLSLQVCAVFQCPSPPECSVPFGLLPPSSPSSSSTGTTSPTATPIDASSHGLGSEFTSSGSTLDAPAVFSSLRIEGTFSPGVELLPVLSVGSDIRLVGADALGVDIAGGKLWTARPFCSTEPLYSMALYGNAHPL